MKLKRLLVVAGVVALMGLLWGAPASADGHLPSMTLDPASVPPEAGDVTLTITGANWPPDLDPFFITACPGAAGDPEPVLNLESQIAAMQLCPDLLTSGVAIEWDGGGFTTEWTVTISQADVDAGAVVIMAGWLSTETLADPESFATVAVLPIVAAEEPMEEEPAAEEEMPVTGHESGLLAVVGVSILVAGLLVVGAGRRLRSVTR